MPQKRNPVALEHARAIGSKALGQAPRDPAHASTTRPSATSSTPRTTCSRWCSRCSRDATRAVSLVAAAMATADIRSSRSSRERAEQGWITVTELADTLARDHGLPFKASHAIAAKLIRRPRDRPSEPRSRVLHDVSLAVLGRAIDYDEPALDALLSARHFVDVRKTPGGPAPSETTRAITASRAVLASDFKWVADAQQKLQRADAALTDTAGQL